MRKHKVGDHRLVKLSGGRIIGTTTKAIVETGFVCLQVSFREETARIYLWQIVPSDALNRPNKKRERLVTFPLSFGLNTAGRFWG